MSWMTMEPELPLQHSIKAIKPNGIKRAQIEAILSDLRRFGATSGDLGQLKAILGDLRRFLCKVQRVS